MSGARAVIVGTGQVRNRPGLDGPLNPVEPARLMAQALERAIADSGVPQLAETADFVGTVSPISWSYEDTPATLASFMGARPSATFQPIPGGDSPGALLNRVANAVAEGEVRIALLAGAESLHGRRRAQKEGMDLSDWTPSDRSFPSMGDQRPIANEIEKRHGVVAPIHAYPLFENALRAAAGRSIAEHQVLVSEFMARYSEVAARNPYSWFPEPRTAEQIRTVTADNRWVSFPYPKLMNAIIDVDQGAALVVMSDAEADRLGVPLEKRVGFLGGAKAVDAWTPTERIDLVSSPAYRAAAKQAFEFAGVGVGDVDAFDLYSCFPSAVQMAALELGLALDDPRGLTRTGGLAHHGGPGNNYVMHSLANMVNTLRAGPERTGYVSGLGMNMAKHSVTLLSTDPARIAAATGRATELELAPDQLTGPPIVTHPEGPATIETYTVLFQRDGTPKTGVVLLRTKDGSRTVAHTEATDTAFKRLLETEGVGQTGHVTPGEAEAPNRFTFDG